MRELLIFLAVTNLMVVEPICCPVCHSTDVVKHGKTDAGKQRYKCRNSECSRHSFILKYSYRGYLRDVKEQIVDMAMNGSGIRDTARVLKISRTTVIEALKKRSFSGASESIIAEATGFNRS